VRLICERICRRERLKVPTSWILPSWSARIWWCDGCDREMLVL
jgi:hypothetical protein